MAKRESSELPKIKRQINRKKSNATSKLKAKKGLFKIALVEGKFLNFNEDFRYALSAVDDLEKTMAESGNYFSVEITKRPLDIESDNRLSGDVSISGRGTTPEALVAFRVVREIKRDD